MDQATCGCPVNEAGDIRCHVCREYVNVRCWNCRTPRGEGACPNPAALDGSRCFKGREGCACMDDYALKNRPT